MPEQVKSPPSGSFEKVFTGSWNAIKTPPEWLGKKTVELYDKLRFPKLTPEEKKMQDKLHAMLKKHYKAVGWTETTVAAGVTTYVITKLYRKFRAGRRVRLDSLTTKKVSVGSPSEAREEVSRKIKELTKATMVFEDKCTHMIDDISEPDQLFIRSCGYDRAKRMFIGDMLIERVMAHLNELPQEVMRINNKESRGDQVRAIEGLLKLRWPALVKDYMSVSEKETMTRYISILTGWYRRAGLPGMKELGILLKSS